MRDKFAAGDYVPDYFGEREYVFTEEEKRQMDKILFQMTHGNRFWKKPEIDGSPFRPYEDREGDFW